MSVDPSIEGVRPCLELSITKYCIFEWVIHHVIMESARPYVFKPSFTRLSIDSSQVTLQIHRQSGHQTRSWLTQPPLACHWLYWHTHLVDYWHFKHCVTRLLSFLNSREVF